MITKRSIIVLLAGLNLLLAVGLLAGVVALPKAHALAPGRAGDFISVSAKARGQAYDVVYVLDKAQEKLHAFYPASIQSKNFNYGQNRDLKKDFAN